MRKILFGGIFSLVALAFVVVPSFASTCTQTGFFRDGINMTAAVINPTGTLTGEVNATGCNVGVYYDNGSVSINKANIHGSNYFGVLVNGDSNVLTASITNSKVHDIGEVPFNGTQHGVAVYLRAFGDGSISGAISGNTVSSYQKGGITANGHVTVNVKDNTVLGNGPVNYIAQNGIQYGWGATGQIQNNTVSGHSYTGANYAADGGILIVGGGCYGGDYTKDVQIVKNTLTNNDVGVYLSNLQDDCTSAPDVATNIKTVNNVITNSAVTNISGLGTIGYQAGIADQGNNDKLINNKISGSGYTPVSGDNPYLRFIDADSSFTNSVKVHANKID